MIEDDSGQLKAKWHEICWNIGKTNSECQIIYFSIHIPYDKTVFHKML